MGQYYIAVVGNHKYDPKVIDKDKTVFFSNKLTEHSMIDNPFVNAVAKQIYKKPQRVAWVGDYVKIGKKEFSCPEYKEKMERLSVPYESVWGGNEPEILKAVRFSCRNKFLVNHSLNLYIEIEKGYPDAFGYFYHPLPLLTAIGNGQGGGDFFGKDEDLIGVWAGDVLSIENEPPAGYILTQFHFEEN